MFIGREKELKALNDMYAKNDFQMMILYGRRRVGKTTLLNQFAEGKNPLYYTAVERKDEENLRGFGRAAFQHFNGIAPNMIFSSYADVLDYITGEIRKRGAKEKQLIILDEYPYMAQSAAELSSVLQRTIDRDWQNLNVMLILCGSSITFMEENVLGAKSPLFGRRTGQLDLQPFDYLTSALFVPQYSPEDKAVVYGATGGIARYLRLFNPGISVSENLIRLFFDTEGYLFEEPENLLRMEFRDVALYSAVLTAIGNGSTRVNEIASKTGFDTAKISQVLRKLEAVRIIRRDVPILNKKNHKLSRYILRDGMFRFWYRFTAGAAGAIERGYGRQYFTSAVGPYLHEYMGPVFEEICQDYTFRCGVRGDFGNTILNVGKWRGSDPVKRIPADIDVVGIDNENNAVIGECKFRNELVGRKEYETLHDRGRLVAPRQVVRYLLFSLSGFTDDLKQEAAQNPKIQLVPIEEMYAGPEG